MAFDNTARPGGRPILLPLLISALLITGLYFATGAASATAAEGAMIAEGVARELMAGTTVGRQALFGNIWYAPLPSLATLLFAPITPESSMDAAARCASLFAVILAAAFLTRHLLPANGAGRGASAGGKAKAGLLKAFLAIPAAVLLFNLAGSILRFDPYLVIPFMTAGVALVKLHSWQKRGRLRDWVKLSALFSLLALCGVRASGFAAIILILALIGNALNDDKGTRFGGLAFLFLSPFVYLLAIWSLMSFLILGDFAYPLRFNRHLFADKSRPAATQAATPEHYAATQDGAEQDAAEQDDEPNPKYWRNAEAHPKAARRLLRDVASYVEGSTPYGRVFVCGYSGLGLLRSAPPELKGRFEPCIDLHIETLRREYVHQNLYFLVRRPARATAFDSATWRYPLLYSEGNGSLLYCADYGEWRLFELIAAQPERQ